MAKAKDEDMNDHSVEEITSVVHKIIGGEDKLDSLIWLLVYNGISAKPEHWETNYTLAEQEMYDMYAAVKSAVLENKIFGA